MTRCLFRLALIAGLFASRPAYAQTATVEGDLYLLTNGGDVKRGATNEVALIPKGSDIAQRWEAICGTQAAAARKKDRADSVAMEAMAYPQRTAYAAAVLNEFLDAMVPAAQLRAVVLKTAALAVSPTGVNGHFRFTAVPAGEYFLFAEMPLRDDLTWWLVPVRVGAKQLVAIDLDNSNTLPSVPLCHEPSPVG